MLLFTSYIKEYLTNLKKISPSMVVVGMVNITFVVY